MCVCARVKSVCVSVCLRGSSDLGGQRRRARGEPMPSRRESSKWVIFISTLDEMVAVALLLLLSAGREISPLSLPAPGEPLGTMGDKLTLIAAG